MERSKLQCLFKVWGHSREEDANGLTVYRPVGFNFPASRGRDGIEFRPDGTIVRMGPGQDDRTRGVTGVWTDTGTNELDVRMGGEDPLPTRMVVVDCNDRVLKVRWDR